MKNASICASIVVLMTPFALAAEDYSQWTYCRPLVLNTTGSGAGVANPVVRFPVLVRLGSADSLVFKNSQANGQDIRFSKYDGTHFPYQIEQWNATNKVAAIWVLADTVFGTDSMAYMEMYWGNAAAADSQNGPAVFDTVNGGFAVVWHLNGNFNDVGNIHMRTFIEGTPADTAAIIANGKKFLLSTSLSTGNYFTDSTLEGQPAKFTLSLWVKEDSTGNSAAEIVTVGDCATLRDDSLGGGGARLCGIGRMGTASSGTETFCGAAPRIKHRGWEYAAYVVNPGSGMAQILYLNGAKYASKDTLGPEDWGSGASINPYTRIGQHPNNMSFGFQGVLNEIRIERVARDSNWIRLCYQNQVGPPLAAPQTLVSLGPVGNPVRLSYSQNPATFWQGVAITPDSAGVTGSVDSFMVFPSLPSGLSLNKLTGTITGTPSGSLAATAYRVVAKNASGGATVSLSIAINGPPPSPALISPADNAVNVSRDASLSWSASAAAVSYEIQLSIDPAYVPAADTVQGATLKGFSSLIAATKYYWRVRAINAAGMSAWAADSFTTAPLPPGPVTLLSPVQNAANVALMPALTWSTGAGATAYNAQVSTSASFQPVADTMLATTSWAIGPLAAGVKYFWRVSASDAGGSSAWTEDSFTTVLNNSIAIAVKNGWNIISLNVHAQDSLAEDLLGTLKGFVLAKTLAKFYWPAQGLDGFDTLQVTQGYQMYCDSADTIRASGHPVSVAATPIALTAGWNMAAYLSQIPIGVDTATASIASKMVLVKNSAGQIFWPDTNYNLNSIGSMRPGQGYQIYMSSAASLTYPSSGQGKELALPRAEMVSMPNVRHFALSLNTGNDAAFLTNRVMIHGAIAPDSSEIGVFDGRENLVGSGTVMHGGAAFSVWGKNEVGQSSAGCDVAEKMSFRLWDGNREYPLEFHGGTEPCYVKDGLYFGSFVAPSGKVISKFALFNAYPNPFRNTIRIFFDVPEIAGKATQDVEIDVYDIKGSIIGRLAKGNYNAGHYAVSWDGAGNAGGKISNLYIVRMKADNFDERLKLFRIR